MRSRYSSSTPGLSCHAHITRPFLCSSLVLPGQTLEKKEKASQSSDLPSLFPSAGSRAFKKASTSSSSSKQAECSMPLAHTSQSAASKTTVRSKEGYRLTHKS